MTAPRTILDPADIYAVLDKHAGNKTQMALELGVHRQTLVKRMNELGISDKPLVAGRIRAEAVNKLPLPPPGKVQRYLLTAAQNNTSAHGKFLSNLKAYKARLEALEGLSVPLHISRFTYNKTAYDNSFMAKPGRGPTQGDHDSVWYDRAIAEFVCDDPERHGSCRYQLAPDLIWCADLNSKPTAPRPLSDLDTHAGNNSAIFPHAKVAMRPMPRMRGEHARFLFTTGCVTQLNYIQRKEGQKAEFHHVYGALIVEVDSNGDWWARQINANSAGAFYDCPRGDITKVDKGVITTGYRAEAMNWGDIHAVEIDAEVKLVNWAPGGAIDKLRPKHQFYNDLLSMRNRNHHDVGKFGKNYEKWVFGQEAVEAEINVTRDLLSYMHRDFCKAVVVSSNHDRHGERWLDEANYKHDFPNVLFFLRAQTARCEAIERGERKNWTFLQWALERSECPPIHFLKLGESYPVGPSHHPVECGLHGDLGPNGARGTTRNLRCMGRRTTKGHDHQGTIDESVYSTGVCQLDMDYAEGPSSWTISHVLTYLNGKRTELSQRAGKLWA